MRTDVFTDNEMKLFEMALNYQIRSIDENTRFWMVRTKEGYFFEEFIKNEFVALGWNRITKDTDLGKSNEESLKEEIKNYYNDSRPMGAINKCRNFISEIHEGDYIIIPNMGSTRIAIAKAGEYYENAQNGYEQEKDIITKIENAEYEVAQTTCPYRKRRHIKLLRIIDPAKMSYALKRAITNYHGLSNLDKYGEDILNCIYDCYEYQGTVTLAVNVGQKDPLKPRDISRLVNGFTEFVYAMAPNGDISIAINLNSPGPVRMKLKNAVEHLTKRKTVLIFLFIAITGGKGLGFELPGITGTIKEMKNMATELEKEKTMLAVEQEKLKTQKIDNVEKMMKIIEEAEKEGIDINYVIEQFDTVETLKDSLQYQSEEIEEETENE